jgi:hypothetical protein
MSHGRVAELVYATLKKDGAGVAELVDAPDSKSGGGNTMRVQVPPPAPSFFKQAGLGLKRFPRS